MLPNAVDHDPRGERVVVAADPSGQFQTTTLSRFDLDRFRAQDLRETPLDDLRSVAIATVAIAAVAVIIATTATTAAAAIAMATNPTLERGSVW